MEYFENKQEPEKVVLAAVDTGDYDCEVSLDELEELAHTAGAEVIARVTQKRDKPDAATFMGSGRLEELKTFCADNEIDLIIFDDELTPSQQRNIERETDVRVVDRTTLILDIFAARARSGEGKLQVELAQLRYSLPRLGGKGKALSRLGGGIGTRGPGETKLESDRRHIRRRIHSLEVELEALEKRRTLARARREKDGVETVAIVGYTNAGKSTLMNTLTQAGVLAEDKLFATLDPTSRALTLPDGRQVMLIDTVGFIRRLPHSLISSFEATLSELKYAEMLLHVIDCADPEMEAHIRVTEALAADMAKEDTPILRVYNKADLAPAELRRDPEGIYISAATGEGIDELLAKIAQQLKGTRRAFEFLIPYSDGAALNLLYRDGRVESVEHGETGVSVRAVCDAKLYAAVQKYDVRGGGQNG